MGSTMQPQRQRHPSRARLRISVPQRHDDRDLAAALRQPLRFQHPATCFVPSVLLRPAYLMTTALPTSCFWLPARKQGGDSSKACTRGRKRWLRRPACEWCVGDEHVDGDPRCRAGGRRGWLPRGADNLPRPSRARGPIAAFSIGPATTFLVSSTPVNSTRRRVSIPKQGNITLKAHVASVYFKCFRGILQVFYTDVVKVDQDVAYVAIVIHVCCKFLFALFHLCFFPDVCYRCFIWM
jgi:hypothetical protein